MKKISASLVLVFLAVFSFASMMSAATVGKNLTAPEVGWQRYDDSYVKGTMTPGSSEGYYQLTGTSTQSAGKNIKFQFYGSKIRLITFSTSDDHASVVSLKIDGVSYTYSEAYESRSQTLVYENTSLENGMHDVVIESVQNGVWTSLDAIDINEDGYIVPFNAPAELQGVAGDKQAVLNWTKVENAQSYTVAYGTEKGKYTEKAVVPSYDYSKYIVPNLSNGTKYYFAVAATVDGTQSAYSNEVILTPAAATNPDPQPEPSGNRALLTITMDNGLVKEFDLSKQETDAFITWYDAKEAGSGSALFAINKSANKGPFINRKDYVIFSKILTFEVNEYTLAD